MSRNGIARALFSLPIVWLATLAPVAAGSVNLLWNASSGATGYKVYSDSNSGAPYASSVTLGNVTQTTITTMPDCAATYFAVTAFNSVGESGYSNEISTWPRPSLTSASPAVGQRGQSLNVVIAGNNFQQTGATVQFSGTGITVNSVTRNACNQITAAISIGSSAAVGPVQLSVANANGVTGTATGLFCVDTCDPTPPTVSMTAPAAGATVSGSVTVSATASDNVGVAGVQFLLDGAPLGAEDTTSPYQIIWDSTAATNGSHTLSARARDAGGNTTTAASRTVTVSNSAPLPDVPNLRRTDKQ